jgi:beta-N-acetylhexosaminidase
MSATSLPDLSLERLCGQLLVVGFDGTSLSDAPEELAVRLASGERAGVIVFKRNVGVSADGALDVERLLALNRAIALATPTELPALISVDQEGGRVKRLGAPVLQVPPMRLLGARTSAEIHAVARQVGRELKSLGFTMSFAPVMDVDTNPDNPVIGDRSFSRDPAEVTRCALAYARGLAEGGVLTCGKHFPGHGDTELDSHLALPRVRHDRARIDAIELAPFRDAIEQLASEGPSGPRLDALMTAHVLFDALDAGVPATFSPKIVREVLRDRLGFSGVCISDDLFMRGVSPAGGDEPHEVAVAAIRAVEAGCDLLLFAHEGPAVRAAHGALIARCRADSAFLARAREGFERALAMRQRARPEVADREALDACLFGAERRNVETLLAAGGR